MQIKPYSSCATRLENRGKTPPTSAYVDRLVHGLEISGIEAIWHSGVDFDGTPLFDSEIFPDCHPQADNNAFKYLIDKVHSLGRPILSWYPMNLGGGVLESHPDWRMLFFEMDGVEKRGNRDQLYACFNSPYGKLLPKFAAELVKDVGFDGVWFDGSTMSLHESGPWWLPGCKCQWCRERFKNDTGCDLPEKIDYDDIVFKRWIRWRYDVLIEVWQDCVEAVKSVREDAVVCFNNYRRRHPNVFAWNVGIPLAQLNCDCMMSGELDGFPHQVDFQIKMHKAYGCGQGVETWWPLRDQRGLWVPDMDPLPAIQASLGAISAGGAICMGIGVQPDIVADSLKAIQDQAGPRIEFAEGMAEEYLAIWCSQQDQDFGCRENPHKAWNRWHGANEISLHCHMQSSIIFDDHVEQGNLIDYPVIVIGSSRCISDTQAGNIEKYVIDGGVIIASEGVGSLDEWGVVRERPVLDDLLGIAKRKGAFHYAGVSTLEISDSNLKEAAGEYVTSRWLDSQPVVAEPLEGVDMLASLVERKGLHWDGVGLDDVPEPRVPGCWIRKMGKGAVIWMCCDIFGAYLECPTPQLRYFLKNILYRFSEPGVQLDAPLCVGMNVRRNQAGSYAIHLHNAPGTAYSYPNPPQANWTHSPGEIVPVRDLKITLKRHAIKSAFSALTGNEYKFCNKSHTVAIPALELHDVVVIDLA